MLQLGTSMFEVDGVQVFADHADRDQFWYLAERVALGERPDGSPAFSLLKYKPAAVEAGVKGGGFLMFQTVVELPEETRNRILGRISTLSPSGTPRLAAAPIETGTVRCLALNLEGGGGTVAVAPPPGAFNAVTKILGATKPSISGDQTAAFSLVLDQEGATILQKAFESGTTPVGVIYELEYSGLTPDLHVKITADLERIYTHFSASVEAQIYWVRGGIDAGFEKLVQEGAIKIEVIDFEGATDKEAKEKWALDFFKNDLLKQWFEPSLDLGQLKGGAQQPEGLDAVLERFKKLQPGDTPKPATDTPKPATGTTTPAPLPPAELKITSTSPAPLPAGRSLTLVPGSTSTTETLEVRGPAGALLTVGGQAKMLDANGRATVEVPAASNQPVTVDWPASAPVDETFNLFFTFEQPEEAGFLPIPTNKVFGSYLKNSPTPPDPRFSQSTAQGKAPPPGGAAALQDWLDNKLIAPKQVKIGAHASFENDSSTAKTVFNQRLSERRLAIARGIIGTRVEIIASEAAGFTRAKAAGNVGREVDRVAEITGKVAGADPAVSIRATLSRAARPAPATTPTTPTPASGGTTTPASGGTPATTGSGTPALVSFRLKFVRQEERKKLEVVYDRKKAVKQPHNPQGFIGLLLDELPDKAKHFVEIDLDDPFFRVLGVDISTPVDFARIGLFTSDVAIDYGDAADPQNHRHQEFRLTAADPGPKRFETFLNAKREIAFRAGFQHHFDANSGWIGEKLSYDIAPRETTDRTLVVDPANDLGFLELQVFPNRIDGGIVEAIDVALAYDDGATFQRTDTFRVLPTSAPQLWRLRLTRPERREWTATFTHHLKNGGTRTTGPISSDASFLPVNDPFDGALDIRAIPLFAPGAAVRQAFVDVTYVDAVNGYRREERIEIAGTATAPVALRIALIDPALRTFRHRVTIVTADGRLIQNEPVDGENTFIGVGQGL